MNHKHVFGKLALSAALLAASAGTAHASADSSTTDRSLHNVKIYHTEAGPVASSVRILPDPLELAKRYAPETLKDWEQALEKYKKLAVAEGKALFITAEAAPFESDPEAQGKPAAIRAAAVAAVKALDIQGQGFPKQWVKTIIRHELKSDDTASDTIASPIEASIAIKAAAAVSPDGIPIEAALGHHEEFKAVKLTESDIAFIEARMELAEAVESKDSAAIKNALAQLLEQYKAQITQLELKAAKEDAGR